MLFLLAKFFTALSNARKYMQGSTFRKKNLGQLTPKFTDLVASKSTSVKGMKS